MNKITTNLQMLAIRAISITMGFVIFSAGWRRFINNPIRHDITNAGHLSNKLVAAAPGSPIESTIHWVLYHPAVSEFSVYAISTIELVLGLFLMIGLLTRLSAVGAAILHFSLMLILGWLGHECLDEWTMAALGFAIAVTIMLTGSGTYSVDHWLKKDFLASWFNPPAIQKLLVILSILVTVGFYQYYFNGLGHFKKETPTGQFRIVAQSIPEHNDQITLYVNAGSSSSPAFVKNITFQLANGEQVVQQPEQIQVVRSHFEPWSLGAGKITDGVMRLTLGSKVDIVIPEGATSAIVDIIDAKKDPKISW
ncbi:TQO small subunit DoxD [Lonepinella sp. MS14435]|uniref:TQO small subunit DoxD n=1 Tax=Lonepinella sp. MS14435 TaxID=3003618 RepID=UPI0036DBABC0